jgi:NADH-quinone oxidoreductase subunit A
MNHQPQVSTLEQLLIYSIGGALFIALAFLTSRLLRPNRPSAAKQMAYESGETPLGAAWVQFNIRFYILALIFILFEVEIVFLFPWSTILSDKVWNEATEGAWSWFAFSEMLIFIVVLAAGLVYVWKAGHLDWIKSNPKTDNQPSPVPPDFYQAVNKKYESLKAPAKHT